MSSRSGSVSARTLQAGFADGRFDITHYRFVATQKFDWSRSFQPNSLELCLNLEGTGTLDNSRTELGLRTVAVYGTEVPAPFFAWRESAQSHHFIVLRYSRDYIAHYTRSHATAVKTPVREYLALQNNRRSFAWVEPMSFNVQNLSRSLIEPPVSGKAAQTIWYEAKALELVSLFLLAPVKAGEFFCSQQKQLTKARVAKARALLERDLENPPSLEMLAQEIGCGSFHLSRIFSQETSMTIPQYLRQLRLGRAAELLRTRQCNVTEAAIRVGYRSLSHFSKAFWETFGCCPGLYSTGFLNGKKVS
jgi:AraC family transcriptional regulator